MLSDSQATGSPQARQVGVVVVHRIATPDGITIENRVMAKGGHMDYWGEPAVADALDDVIKRHLATL
jgi:hypothetical protein